MNYRNLFLLIYLTLFLACRDSSIANSSETPKDQQKIIQKENNQVVSNENKHVVNSENKQVVKSENNQVISDEEEIWVPSAIEDCISKIDVGEPFKFETSFNPYYLRANLDDNQQMDYAVIIKGQNTQKRAVAICKDAKQPFLFGELSKPKTPLSSFENDNFVTDQWDVSSKEETRERIVKHSGGRKIAPNAKGESIAFLFEGGDGVVIYWDGKGFQVGE